MSDNLISIQIDTLDCRDVGGRRHEFQDCIQQFLNAFVSVRRTTAYRNCRALAGRFSQHSLHSLDRRLLAFQIFHHQIVVQLADLLHKLCVVQFRVVRHILRDILDTNILAFFIVVDVGFHLKQVNNTFELVLFADWQLKTDCILAQSGLDLVYRIIKICAQDIHLVDECHSRYIISVGLTPYILRLRLHTTLCTEDAHSTVQHTE